jgi:hypothetical protein
MERVLEGCNTRVRQATDNAYAKFVQKIFEVLEAIARESESHADDKEQLNRHIITIENMHHFYLEVRACKVASLDPFIKMSKASYDLHLSTYIKMNTRRTIGKMLVSLVNHPAIPTDSYVSHGNRNFSTVWKYCLKLLHHKRSNFMFLITKLN